MDIKLPPALDVAAQEICKSVVKEMERLCNYDKEQNLLLHINVIKQLIGFTTIYDTFDAPNFEPDNFDYTDRALSEILEYIVGLMDFYGISSEANLTMTNKAD